MLCNKLSCLHAIIFACLGICFAINTFASQFVNTNMTSVFLIIFFASTCYINNRYLYFGSHLLISSPLPI